MDSVFAFRSSLEQLEIYQYTHINDSVRGPVRRLIASGHKRLNFSIAAHKDTDIYVTGGTLDGAITYKAECFSLSKLTFELIKPMD